jgi:hypothetical protein
VHSEVIGNKSIARKPCAGIASIALLDPSFAQKTLRKLPYLIAPIFLQKSGKSENLPTLSKVIRE